MFVSWWRGLVRTANAKNEKSKGVHRSRLPRKLRFMARVEQLEDRVVPAGSTSIFLAIDPAITNVAAARSATVPVFIDTGTLTGGAGGIQSGTFYVRYDPAVLSINETSDIRLGFLLSSFPSGTYAVGAAAGSGPGVVGVGITHATSTFYTGTAGGHLVELDFHVLQTIPVGQSTLLDVVPTISGHLTVVADVSGTKYTTTPAPTVYAGTTLTQPGALTPATFKPADTDAADATIQVVAQTPAVKPAAVNDSYSTAPNNGSFPSTMTVTGLANGVLANDTDASGPMNAVLVGGSTITVGTATINGVPTTTYTQNTAHGSVTLNAVDGSFSYTPAANFTGSDSFTYQAVDALSNTASATATVTIQVGGFESIPQNLTLDASNPSNTVTVPVNIANPDPANSGGLVTAIIAINYDKSKFTVTGATIGSVLKNAGWTSFVPNFSTPGRVNISTSGPAITSTKGGDLADITFKPISGIINGTSVVNLAGTGTELDVAGTGTPLVLPFAVAPLDNPTTISSAADGLITVTGGVQATATTTTVSTSNATPVYGTAVTLTATVAPATGTDAPAQGSVAFYINGNVALGAGTSAGSDANHDALFTYVTGATQLQVDGGPQPILAVYTAGTGFSSSTSTNAVTETVTPAPLTVTAITAGDKVYDATTKAILNAASAVLAGVIAGDTLTLSTAGATGTFASKNAGTGITVNVSGLTVSGTQAANYVLTQPTTTANITPATLTVTSVTANNKVYDGTKTATLNTTGATLVGVIAGDTVTLNAAGATGTFAGKDVGNNITVTAVGLGLGGPQGANYTLTQPTTAATITPATLMVTGISAKDKVYDTTTVATLNTTGAALAGLFAGDAVTLNTAAATGTFASKNAGTNIAVTVIGLTIAGAQAGDYTLTQPTPTANITPAPLTVNLTAKDKVYDATTKATLNTGSASLSGVLGSDLVSLNASGAKGVFASKDVGNGITVSVSGVTLTGAQAGNYSLAQPTPTANITPAALTVTGITAADKVYDATTKATLTTTAAALVGVFAGDTVTLSTTRATGAFLTKSVGSGKTVIVSGLTLGGAQAADYTVTPPTPTANITPVTLTVAGITAKDKKYDATTSTASFNTGSAVLTGVLGTDIVTVASATGTFASKDVANAIPVTISAVTLGGAQGVNYKVTPPTAPLTGNITPAALTVTGITANKVYDATKAATLNMASAALAGVFAGDTVTLNKTGATGVFASKDVGNGITVTVSGLTISGAQAGDYTLTQPTPTANITPAPLTVAGITAKDKIFDGTTIATLNTAGATLVGVFAGDTVTLSTAGATGTFASKDGGHGIKVTIAGLTIGGAQAGDYTLTQPTTTANITPNVFLNAGPAINNIVSARSATVPVFIDTATLIGGAGGIQSGTFYVRYDPAVLSINESTVAPGAAGSDIKLGSLLSGFPAGTYAVTTAAGFGPGMVGVGITHATSTFYTGTAGGHLVELDFHVQQTISVDQSTLLDIVPSTAGHVTVLADIHGDKYTVAALTTYAGTTLTQPGALTPATFSPADTDAADATIQVVAQTPAVKPTAVNDTFSMAPNNGAFPSTMTVTGLANGVLANDTDANGPMNAVLVGGGTITVGTATLNGVPTTTYTQNTAHGSVTLNAVDGSFSYTPTANFTGLDSFTYQAVDALSNTASATATVAIQVGGLESIPQNLTLDASNPSNTVTVPVNIANPDPANSGGLVTAIIAIKYDKSKFTVTGATIGSVLKNAGWTSFVSNFSTPGRVNISTSGPAITNTKGGDLADITFKPISGIINGTSVVNLAGTGTELDVAGTGTPLVLPFAVAPADNPTTIPGPADGLITVTGGVQVTVTTTTVSTSNATPVYGTAVTLTATVAPATGPDVPAQGSVAFYIDGNVSLGAGTSVGPDANHDLLFTYVTGATQLQVDGGPQPILAVYTAGAGFASSTSTNAVTETVTPAPLTVTGITASDKVYDATTKATLNTAGAALVGVIAGDTVTMSTASATGTFASRNAGSGITVNVSGLTVSGAQAANYALTQPTTTANITPATLTVTGVTANNKVYDGTKTATLNTAGATLVGVIAGDTVTLSAAGATGTFASKDVGNNITVTPSGLTLAGAQGGNYTLTQPGPTAANITPATLTVTGITAKDKVYDTTTAATLNMAGAALAGLVAGDTVTLNTAAAAGTFATKNAGTNIAVTVTGLTIAGAQAGDYTLTQPTPTANITPAPLTVNLTAKDKVYDSTTKATLNTGSASLSGVLGSDLVSLNASGAKGVFASKDVGTGITVTVSGLTLSGAQAGNYSLTQPTPTANITPAALTVTGITAADKVYDATTKATLNTTAAALVGVFAGDTVTLSTTGATGVFLTKSVGSGKTVIVSGLTLGGAQAADYTVTPPTPTANITPVTLTVAGITAKDKKYDATATASFSTGSAVLTGVLGTDIVTVTGATGTFASKDVGNGIKVTISAVTLGGAQAGNYKVTPPASLTANITPVALTVTGITANNKVYDATKTATLNTASAALAGVLAGDTVTLNKSATGTFASKDVGNGITVTASGLTLAGAQAGNYTLTQPTLTANITPAPLTVTGITANKVYDATTKATLNTSSATLVGVIAGDTVTSNAAGATGTFASKDVGNGIKVTISALALAGAQAADYTLTQPTLTANITPAPLTITAAPNTKTFDGTASAAAIPTVAGLLGSDTVTGLSEAYNNASLGTGKTLLVTGYTVNDGNNGNDYLVSIVLNRTGMILALPQFSVSAPSTATAGSPFLVTVTAQDGGGHTNSGYGGAVHFTSTDPQAVLPPDSTLTNGVGSFLVTLKTVLGGPWTVTARDTVTATLIGTSGNITVTPATASNFTIVVPGGTVTTGSPVNVTVTAFDQFNNIATGYGGHVHFTSSDASASLPADSTLTGGVGVFAVTLKTAGSQTITATDSLSVNPIISGTGTAIAVRGLTVTSFTPTFTGFTATFSKPFVAADVSLWGGTVANKIQNVTLVGTTNGFVNGSLVIDPTNTSITFKASALYLSTFFSGSTVLPNDTWKVTLASGTGTGATANGFFDALGAGLDGAGNGGHANYTTTFTTTNAGKPALSIPDFARGPDGSSTIKVPNDTAKGIPVTLSNVPAASGVKDVVFTLSYNPTLFVPTAGGTGDSSGTGSTFVMGTPTSVDATHSTVTFTWHNGTAQSGTVVLGDILANVPNSAANQYKGKEILGIVGSSITVNGAAFTGVWANGLHVNAYFGDVTGDGKITALDVATANSVSQGSPTSPIGLSAHRLVDPAIMGDIAGDASIDATAVSDLAAFTSNLNPPQIPAPPTGLTITPGGPDPTLSLGEPSGGVGRIGNPSGVRRISNPSYSGIVSVPVMLDHPHPDGSTGMEEAILALTYDPSVLTVSSADITLGSIPGLGAGWHLVSVVDQRAGQIGIDLYSTTAITATQAGSLVNIAFHVVPGASVPRAAVQLVNSVTPRNQWFSTEVADAQGQFVLSPGMDRLVVETGASPVLAAPSSTSAVVTAAVYEQVPVESLARGIAEEAAGSSSLLGTEANDLLAVISNGVVAGEEAAPHAVPANLVVTGALAFQTNVTAIATAQLASQVFQAGSPTVNMLQKGNSPQQLTDRLFLALVRGTDAYVDVNPLNPFQDSFRDGAAVQLDWLADQSQSLPVGARPYRSYQGSADQKAGMDRSAMVDEVFAQLANDMDDFADFGDY